MMCSPPSELIAQLQHKSSPKRRAAAKKIRKQRHYEYGAILLTALKNELKDKRTWETQYQMIMALGDSGYIESLDFLIQLAEQEFEATMIHVAIGDAVTALEYTINSSPISLARWIEADKKDLVNGGIRSLAILHIVPSNSYVQKIIQYVSLQNNQDLQFWAIAAAPGWPKQSTKKFLEQAMNFTELQDTKKAALAALNGKYLKWKPL